MSKNQIEEKTFFCETCEKHFSFRNKERHLETKYHIKRYEIKIFFETIKENIKNSNKKEGGDIVKSITDSRWIPKFFKTEHGELHLTGHNSHKFHNFLGPMTRLDIRLDENDIPKP